MKRSSIVLLITSMALVGFIVTSVGTLQAGLPAGDTSEADGCASCHYYPDQDKVQGEIVDEWKESSHGNSYGSSNSNTYCAKCHSPFQADPEATHSNHDPVPQEEWQGVTCSSCHPPHSKRVEWGTPIGYYDVAEQEWTPVYEGDTNELCTHCHESWRHESIFSPGPGNTMEKKGVECIDCHMPVVPTEGTDKDHRSHNWHILESTDNPEYSCGLERSECHDSHDADWAAKQIDKGIHTVGYDPDAQHPWQDNQGQTKDK